MAYKHRLYLEANQTPHAEPHRSLSSSQNQQNELTTSQQNILALQHTHGNGAVLRMFGRNNTALAQRAPQIGWNTREMEPIKENGKNTGKWQRKRTTGPNAGETFVPVDDKDASLGGARRIPVRGLGKGSSTSDASETDWLGNTVSSTTKETADEKQAIVIIPDKLNLDQPVGVLLHLQGLTVGYRNDKGKVEDVDIARIEQQLRASERNMIAILPQAGLASRSPQFGGVNRDSYIKEVFDFLNTEDLWTPGQPLQKTPSPGSIVFSSYSGGAFTALPMLEQDVSKENVKKGNINPGNMGEVILFDSIHVNSKGVDQVPGVINWLMAQLNNDLNNLKAMNAQYPDELERQTAQLKYVRGSMKFRGIHTNDYYAKQYNRVKDALDKWFKATEDSKVLPPLVLGWLEHNYQVIPMGHGSHGTLISKGDPLKNALMDAPETIGKTGNSATKTPPPNVQPTSNIQRMPTNGTLQRQPAAPDAQANADAKQKAAVTPAQALIDATVRLAESGTTRMQPDYIRNKLQSRSGNVDLAKQFDTLVLFVTFQQSIPFMADIAAEYAAQELVKFLEQQFINDPKASTLDFLARGQDYRNRKWDRLDYPGHAEGEAAGPNEGEATRMMRDLRAIEAERRPNSGTTAVVDETEFNSDAQLQKYIVKQLQQVPDITAGAGNGGKAISQSGQRLNASALADFLLMRQAASTDGVDLIIRDGYRTPATTKAHGAGQNPQALAQGLSSHNLGLAMDLTLSHGRQQYQETTTRPMQNVVDMHESPAHKWMFLHGPDYGWFPWHNEPWHWEYNPDGFRDKFHTDYQQWLVDNPPASTRKRK